MKRFWLEALCCVIVLSCTPSLKRGQWEEETYNALSSLISDKGNRGGYAVFDCDNTSILHDVTHTLMLYQIENLRFAAAPEHSFLEGLGDVDFPLEGIGMTARETGRELAREYYSLKDNFNDSLYLAFRARFLAFYEAVGANYDYGTLCIWEPSLANGFTREELLDLGRGSINYWLSQGRVWRETWVSPDGRFSGTAQKGLVVTDDMKSLYKALGKAGITPYICSASPEWLVEILATDRKLGFGLSPEQVFGIRLDGAGDYPQPYKEGKVECIGRFIAPLHGGAQPLLVAGDSEGDLAMLKAYPSMKIGLVMNQFRGGEIEDLAYARDGRYYGQSVCIDETHAIRKSLLEMPSRAGGCYHSYEEPQITDTPAPKGYKPFYISHYGRHGSRYHTPKMLSRCYPRELEKAASLGMLTDNGLKVLERMQEVYKAHEGKIGDLAIRGEREHRGIGMRMAGRFPEVFAGRDSVIAVATHYPRCQASMRSFLEGLGSAAKAVSTDAGRQYYSVLCHDYEDQTAVFDEVSALQRSIRDRRTDPSGMQARLFKEGCEPDSIQVILKGIYIYGCQEEDLDLPEEGRLFSFFTPRELFQQWSIYSDVVYGEMGPSKEYSGKVVPSAKSLVADIVSKASAAVDGADVAAHLRFGHDNGLVPLLSLMGVEGYTAVVPIDGARKVWPSFERIPMASNLQMVFYRGSSADDVIVKLLLNEKETRIPGLESYSGPYYKWSILEPYLKSKAE